ncbi:MAG: hypothetical protein ABJL55_16290 [Roseibium sp.]
MSHYNDYKSIIEDLQATGDFVLSHLGTLVSATGGSFLGGVATGALLGAAGFNPVTVVAFDLEEKPLRRAKAFLALIGGLKQWAASLNASPMFVHVTTGTNLKSTDRLMRSAGAQFVGGAYVV